MHTFEPKSFTAVSDVKKSQLGKSEHRIKTFRMVFVSIKQVFNKETTRVMY